MRALTHPAPEDITVQGILYALADPVRAEILAQLMRSSCAQSCSSFVKTRDRQLAKSTLSHHYRILREAGLIRSERCGVELRNTPRCAEIERRFGSLVRSILESYGHTLPRKPKSKPATRSVV